jgi:hypothetical protein
MLPSQLRANGLHLRLRLREGRGAGEAGEGDEPAPLAPIQTLGPERNPDVDPLQVGHFKALRKDPRDLIGMLVEKQRSSHSPGIAGEVCPPEGMADERNVLAPGFQVASLEEASGDRLHGKRREDSGSGHSPPSAHGLVLQLHGKGPASREADRLQRATHAAPVPRIGGGGCAPIPDLLEVGLAYIHQPVGFRVGQGTKQNPFDEAENGGVGPDSQGKGEQYRGGEAGGPRQSTAGQAQVAKNFGHRKLLRGGRRTCVISKSYATAEFQEVPTADVAALARIVRSWERPSRKRTAHRLEDSFGGSFSSFWDRE